MRNDDIASHSIEPWLLITALCCTGIATIATLYCSIWIYTNRKKSIVVAHQTELLLIVCVGLLLRLLSTVPLSITDSNSSCLTYVWFYNIGFMITFGGMYSKLWRINKILYNPHLKLIEIIFPLAFLLTVMIPLLVALSIFDPPLWTEEFRRNKDGTSYWYGYCESSGDVSIYLYTTMGLLRIVTVFAAIYQAYLARNISSNFSETWPLPLSLLNCIQLAILYYPLNALLLNVAPSATYFLNVSTVLFESTWILLAIFLPLYLHLNKRQTGPTIIGSNVRIDRTNQDPVTVVSGMSNSNTVRDDTETSAENGTSLTSTKDQSTASIVPTNSSVENVGIDDKTDCELQP